MCDVELVSTLCAYVMVAAYLSLGVYFAFLSLAYVANGAAKIVGWLIAKIKAVSKRHRITVVSDSA